MDEVSARADKHIEAEETTASKDERDTTTRRRQYFPPKRATLADHHHFSGKHYRGGRARNRKSCPKSEVAYTPLKAKLSTILNEGLIDGSIQRLAPFVGTMGKNPQTYYRHRTEGRTTDDCWTLKQQIEQLIQRGYLKKFVLIEEQTKGRANSLQPRPATKKGEAHKETRQKDVPEKENEARR